MICEGNCLFVLTKPRSVLEQEFLRYALKDFHCLHRRVFLRTCSFDWQLKRLCFSSEIGNRDLKDSHVKDATAILNWNLIFAILCSALRYKTLLYIILCYIDSRFILPWNFRARFYDAAASQPCVFARLLVGNKEAGKKKLKDFRLRDHVLFW